MKLFHKIASISLGLSLALGIGVVASRVGSDARETAYAADGDEHEFAQDLSQLLNNNAAIASINIAQQSYPVKEVIVSYRYNKTLTNAVTIEVSVGGVSWGQEYTVGTDKNYTTCSFTGDVAQGAITVSFTNNTGSGTGHGTFYVNNITLVEGVITTPSFTLDKDSVELLTESSPTTITATPNQYVSNDAQYVWEKTSGDDCVTLTNANTPTVTIAPKGNAASASCILTISVTGCTPKTVSVTVTKALTVAEALALTSGEAYVKGIVSTVTEVSTQHGNATYRISDDGTTENEMIVYRGKYLENAAFTSADQIQVGYEVIVKGTLSVYNNATQLATGNYLVSLVKPVEHNVSTTTNGLTLDRTKITSSGNVVLTTAAKKKATNISVTNADFEVSGRTVSLSNVSGDVVITADIVDASVSKIALSGQKVKFNLTEDFVFDGTVTATYDDFIATHTQEAIATGYSVDSSAFRKGVEGTYQITVSYSGKSASYNVKVADLFDASKGEYHIAVASDIVDGANIAIAAGEYDVVMANYNDGNNFPNGEGEKNNEKGIVDKTNATNLTLVAGTGDYAGYFMMKLTDDRLLYAAGGTGGSPKNQLKASDSITPDERFYFSFVKVSDTNWTITAKGGATRNTIRYNTTDHLFSCYASGGQDAVTVYAFEKYQTEAEKYAETFIKGNGSANTCAATIDNWTSLGTAFGKLTDGAQDLFKKATHNAAETYTTPSEYTVEHAVARYDDALLKHTELRSNEFMGRVAQGTLVYGSAFLKTNENNNNSNVAVVVIVTSVISLTAVAGYFLLKKKHA